MGRSPGVARALRAAPAPATVSGPFRAARTPRFPAFQAPAWAEPWPSVKRRRKAKNLPTLLLDERAHAYVGEDFQEEGVGEFSVDYVCSGDAGFEGTEAGFDLWQHTGGDCAVGD